MRALIGLAAAVAGLAGAQPALGGQAVTDPNGLFLDLNVAVSPPVAGSAAAPQGVAVRFQSFAGDRIDGNLIGNIASVAVRFNRGFRENGLRFPACNIALSGISQCPKRTQIGTGTGEAELPGSSGSPPTFLPATLAEYNGAPVGGKSPTLIFIASINGIPSAEYNFVVRQEPKGPYGLAIKEIIPPGAITTVEITKFSVVMPDRVITHRLPNGKVVKVHFLQAPTTCHGSWQFAQTDTFTNALPLTATDSQPCTR